MKRVLKALAQVILVAAILGGLGWLSFCVLGASVRALGGLHSDVAVAVVAAAVTVIVSVITLIITKYLETKATITQQLRERKVPVYEEFISTMFGMLFAEKVGQERMTEPEIIKFFVSWTERLVIWGSDDVVKEFRAFRMHFVNVDADAPPSRHAFEGMFRFEKVMLAVRRDLGHSNVNLGRGSILGLFVNDIDQYV